MRISDWSSDVCSSDLLLRLFIIFGDEHVEFGLQRLAARFGLVDLRLVGGLDLLRRGGEGVRTGGGDATIGHSDPARLRGGRAGQNRWDESRDGAEGVGPCRSRWSPVP